MRGPKSVVTCGDLSIDMAAPQSTSARPSANSRESVAAQLFDRMVRGREPFWTAVYPAFMARDLMRDDIRELVTRGLEQAHGSYKIVVELFNMRPEEYKRFLNFLKKHNCQMPFYQFRTAAVRGAREKDGEDAFAGSAASGL